MMKWIFHSDYLISHCFIQMKVQALWYLQHNADSARMDYGSKCLAPGIPGKSDHRGWTLLLAISIADHGMIMKDLQNPISIPLTCHDLPPWLFHQCGEIVLNPSYTKRTWNGHWNNVLKCLETTTLNDPIDTSAPQKKPLTNINKFINIGWYLHCQSPAAKNEGRGRLEMALITNDQHAHWKKLSDSSVDHTASLETILLLDM